MVVCGPSGVGKGTLIKRLRDKHKEPFGFSVSHTTRAPRPGEEEGVHYHFVSSEEMKDMVTRGDFLEWANVHGNMYGTSKAGVQRVIDAGKICILEIDVQGAEQVKRAGIEPQPKFLYIGPPSREDLEKRLRGRGTETEEKVQLRLENAKKELEYMYKEEFWDSVVINDDVDAALARLEKTLSIWWPSHLVL